MNSVGCDMKNKKLDVGWVVKWCVKINKVVFECVKWVFFFFFFFKLFRIWDSNALIYKKYIIIVTIYIILT